MSEPRFSLVLLGPPLVRRGELEGREVEVEWRLRRALLAVAYLALRSDRRSDKETLVEAIWPEASAEAIAKNFHPTLSDARRTLGAGREAITYRQGVYALSPEIDWQVDVERFRGLIATGHERRSAAPAAAVESWLEAWRLYRGPLLMGHDLPWILKWREALREEYLAVLAELGRLAGELGELIRALDAYRSVLLEEPYEEHVHQAVMEIYARQGRRDLVRRQYVRLQENLKELNVEPLETTQECYHRLMR